MMDCCVKDCQSRPLNTKWPESSPMWSGAGCSLAVQTRQTTSDLSHIRFGPKSEKDSDLRFFTVWPRSDKVCTPISAGLLRHSRSPFFLIVPRREILAESFPGGGSHSDNAGWSWVCFRIHAAKTCTEAAATRSLSHHSACALLHLSTLSRLFRQHTCFHCTVTSKRHCIHPYICGSSTSPCLPSQRDVTWSFRACGSRQGPRAVSTGVRLIEWATVEKTKRRQDGNVSGVVHCDFTKCPAGETVSGCDSARFERIVVLAPS